MPKQAVVRVLKGEDIIVLLKLVDPPSHWTVRWLADETTIPRSVVHRAVQRLEISRLYSKVMRRANVLHTEEFLVHGLRYVFPPIFSGVTIGMPTAWAASPLKGPIVSNDELPPVWPHASGEVRGLSLAPLHSCCVEASQRDPNLGECLVLVDGLRLGDARIRGVAHELLAERLKPTSAAVGQDGPPAHTL